MLKYVKRFHLCTKNIWNPSLLLFVHLLVENFDLFSQIVATTLTASNVLLNYIIYPFIIEFNV